MPRKPKSNGWALVILPGLLTSTVLLLLGAPPVYASSCSSTGGNNGSSHYYAGFIDTTDNSGKFYGVGVSYTNMSKWTFNTPTSESIQTWWVSLDLASHGWSQPGVAMGYLDGQTISSRSIYFEQSITGGTPNMVYVSGHTVPNKDTGYFEAWLYVGSNGDYWTTDEVSSSAEGTWSTNYDLGSSSSSLSYGTGEHAIETAYTTTGLTCNQYAGYSESDFLLYSTSLGTAPESSGSYWGNCSIIHNSPYSVVSSGGACISYAVYSFSGG